jgi:hypothetical protein
MAHAAMIPQTKKRAASMAALFLAEILNLTDIEARALQNFRGYENQQFSTIIHIFGRSEQDADKREIAEKWHPGNLVSLDGFVNTTEHHGLTVVDQ